MHSYDLITYTTVSWLYKSNQMRMSKTGHGRYTMNIKRSITAFERQCFVRLRHEWNLDCTHTHSVTKAKGSRKHQKKVVVIYRKICVFMIVS